MMKDFKTYISRVKSLEELNVLKESINKELSERETYLNMVNKGNEISQESFGFIKEAFEKISPELYKSKEGKNVIKKYISEINANKALKKLYHIYENICHADSNIDVNFLIDKSFVSSLDKKSLNEGIKNTGRILAEGFFILGGNSDFNSLNENKKLNESIEYLATSSNSMKSLPKRSECVSVIKSYLSENMGKNVRNIKENYTDADSILEAYNEKYGNSENIDLIKQILKSDKKDTIFEGYKKTCEEAISKAIEENKTDVNAERLSSLLESVRGKVYNEATIGTDIANFIELTELINE